MPIRDEPALCERTILDGPVTRRELDRIQRRLREPPAPERHLTPGGALEHAIKRIQREDDAIRASFSDRSLKCAQERLERDFVRADERER